MSEQARGTRSGRPPWAAAVLLSGALVLVGCGGGDVDPGEAETGVPLSTGEADPAVSPTDSGDPLTGSSP